MLATIHVLTNYYQILHYLTESVLIYTNLLPLRINWDIQHPWTSPRFLGPALRGMFGSNLHRLSHAETSTATCPQPNHSNCAYCNVFESRKTGSLNSPPLFVLQPPPPGIRSYQSGQLLSCTQLLFGTAVHHLPDIFQAWLSATLESAPDVLRLASIDICTPDGALVKRWHHSEPVPEPVIQPLPEPAHAPQNLHLELLTPLCMREQGKDIRPQNLAPEHLIMGAMRRSRLLVPDWHNRAFHNPLPPQLLAAWAKTVSLEHELEWFEEKRWSHRQKKEIPVKGLLGHLKLSGNLEPFWPALSITPWIGLGKFCNFGLGHVSLRK